MVTVLQKREGTESLLRSVFVHGDFGELGEVAKSLFCERVVGATVEAGEVGEVLNSSVGYRFGMESKSGEIGQELKPRIRKFVWEKKESAKMEKMADVKIGKRSGGEESEISEIAEGTDASTSDAGDFGERKLSEQRE